MKFSFELNEELAGALDRLARATGRSWSDIVESALRRFLRLPPVRADLLPPLPTFDSGGHLVDIADRDALYRAMEEDDPSWLYLYRPNPPERA